jgi:hypothetical protein
LTESADMAHCPWRGSSSITVMEEHDLGFSVHIFECDQQFTHWPRVTLGGDQHPGLED